MPGEVKVGEFRQARVFMAGDRQNLTVVQTELAGKAQDLFCFTRYGKHDRQRVSGHVVSDREIRIVNVITEFTTFEKKRAPYFASAPDVPAPTNIIRSDDNIISTA